MSLDRPLIVGNWKMHGDRAFARALTQEIVAGCRARPAGSPAGVALCPPALWLDTVRQELERMSGKGPAIRLGGQDCHMEAEGAFTGNISAGMLADAGCSYVILGHSERRRQHHETNALLRHKMEAALAAGLIPIYCIGETLAEREQGRTLEVLQAQLEEGAPEGQAARLVIAYEPVWAIGSGQSAAPQDIETAHAAIARWWATQTGQAPEEAVILYGGSVKAAYAAEILGLSGVQGVLVGGASLQAAEFCRIIAEADRVYSGLRTAAAHCQ